MEAKVKADKNIIRIIKGSAFSILITLILLFIYAILLTSTNIPESTMSVVVITITGISILIGSSFSNTKIKKNAPIKDPNFILWNTEGRVMNIRPGPLFIAD